MAGHDGPSEYQEIAEKLQARLRNRKSCPAIVDGYEELLRSIWSFLGTLLGDGGARVVIVYAIKTATEKAPLAQKLVVQPNGVDFGEFRDHVAKAGCGSVEVMAALTHVGVKIFETLSSLTGEAITGPLMRYLEEENH